MFYLIGLGPNAKSLSLEALEACTKCKKLYLESYTAKIPYSLDDLKKLVKKEVALLKREEVEEELFLKEAKKQDIALLVYGSPLAATTHISLLLKCRKERIPYKIFHNAGILETIGETGLQLYKFGKTASMPQWTSNHQPASFLDMIKENQEINAHSLILVDIGLSFKDALQQLIKTTKETKIKIDKITICSQLGTENQKIFYNTIENLKQQEVKEPFCFIIPGKLHFLEEEMLGYYS